MSRKSHHVLAAGLLVLALLGAPAGGGTAAAAPAPSPERTAALTTAQFEARLVALTNARRARVGCPALTQHTSLIAAARRHTSLMVQVGRLSHQLPREAGLAFRIVRAGYTNWRLLGENLAWGRGLTPAGVFRLWINSAPHRANIQNCRFRHVGYGVRFVGGAVWATGDYGRR